MVMTDAQLLIALTSIGTLLVTFITAVGAYLDRAARARATKAEQAVAAAQLEQARRWAVEDRKAASEERAAATAEIIAKAKAEAEALEIRTAATAAAALVEAKAATAQAIEEQKALSLQIADRVNEVHAVAEKAFHEANNTSQKQQVTNKQIEDLNERLLSQGAVTVGAAQKLDHVQVTTDEAVEKLESIEGKVDVIQQRQAGRKSDGNSDGRQGERRLQTT